MTSFGAIILGICWNKEVAEGLRRAVKIVRRLKIILQNDGHLEPFICITEDCLVFFEVSALFVFMANYVYFARVPSSQTSLQASGWHCFPDHVPKLWLVW